MTTNPPLTAKDVELLVRGYDVPVKPEESERRDYLMDTFIHMDNQEVIEAYAAQQNAELVATISQLNSDIAGLKSQLKDAEINFKALADGMIRDEAIGMLRAENERLKQQLASNFERRPIMTNDQQAYDRAMAHNAILREALHDLYTEHPSTTWSEDVYVLKALNATEADVTAWERNLREQVMLAVHPLQPEYEKLQQQLATVTDERDALREFVKAIDCECQRDVMDVIGGAPIYGAVVQPCDRCEALAQKGGE